MSQERLKISWQHLTQEDADLLSFWRIDAPITVMNIDDGFTVGTGGWWRPGTILENRLQKLRDAGHSEAFVEAVRWAGSKEAWSVRFCEEGEVQSDIPLGGYGTGPTPR
ncbi:MAG: hypothetical protein CL627_10160 [Aurantimonas sp.]|uniref:hypothetical protein n=1 Tax=Aurantimonas TaxID=182269 RepID=UPI000C47AECC|nr:hypothetical protein [Aurantimonas coralicida]MAY29567.1 hypothetical protein [Aurantimonas sp.]MCD1645399.1 hypothetical protein [Aurantimonas coralicida]MCW7543133.1 hypothetical protein [Aurantimonas litoralis]